MHKAVVGSHLGFFAAPVRLGAVALGGSLALAVTLSAQTMQLPAPPGATQQALAAVAESAASAAPAAVETSKAAEAAPARGAVKENEASQSEASTAAGR
jgi:hypothetical protein